LDELIGGLITFEEAEERSVKLKALFSTKMALLEEVNIETWDTAKRVIPNFTKEDVLSKFQLQKGKPLPRSFKVSKLSY